MISFYYYFYIALSAGGILTSVYMVRQIYKIINDQSIPRKTKKPITPQSEPVIYWTFVGWTALCTMGIIWGAALAISTLLHS